MSIFFPHIKVQEKFLTEIYVTISNGNSNLLNIYKIIPITVHIMYSLKKRKK